MNADKKSAELAADTKSSSGNNNSISETKGKNKAKPEKDNSSEDEDAEAEEEENGSRDTKNGANNKKNEGPMALGEIAFIDSKITSTKIDGLQPLYNICFDVAGKAQTLKKNLRTFKGFAFKADSSDFTKKVDAVQKLDVKVLKATCDILDVDKKGTNKEIAERVCQFLLSPDGEPEPSEDEDAEEEEEEEESEEEKPKKKGPPAKRGSAPAGRPRRSTAGRNFSHDDFLSSEESEEEEPKAKSKRKRGDTDSGSDYNPSLASDSDTGRKKPRAAGTRRSARYQSNSEDEEDDDFVSSEEDSDAPKKNKRGAPARRAAPAARGRRKKETESEESDPEEDSEDSDAPKKKKAPAKKEAAASPPKGRGRPKRETTSKKKTRDQTTSEEEEEEVDEELSHLQDKEDMSEDEPLSKKPKSSAAFPSDDDIKGYVKKILDEANLEEITMKTVCKEVYAQFPGHDLTQKKDFIKATVKSLIAT